MRIEGMLTTKKDFWLVSILPVIMLEGGKEDDITIGLHWIVFGVSLTFKSKRKKS